MSASTFTMSGGEIYGNTAGAGAGGVSAGTFTMSGGKIYGNTASSSGGGVSAGTFTMSGGKIYGNTAGGYGGGGVRASTFTMSGGEIYGNTATVSNIYSDGGGGGVSAGTFTKTGGGIIRGYSVEDALSNKVTNTDNDILPNRGHAVVYTDYYSSKRYEATVDEAHDLDSTKDGVEGGWDVQ